VHTLIYIGVQTFIEAKYDSCNRFFLILQRDYSEFSFSYISISTDFKLSIAHLNLESVVEHGFAGNPGVSSKASFVVNGNTLNKNDKASRILLTPLTYISVGEEAGLAGVFHKCL
jgi:hypothetical protein